MPGGDCLPISGFFFADANRVLKNYIKTIEPPTDPKELEEFLNYWEGKTKEREAHSINEWLYVVHTMSQGDFTKWDYFFNMPVVEFLNAHLLHEDMQNKWSRSFTKDDTADAISAKALSLILFNK